ncbi:MAG: hypothetical protein M1825_005216 [Sarcosagium campestre]|nr:MAG: hypothetical protein M1825_005216 [Sarcosagium campestre]
MLAPGGAYAEYATAPSNTVFKLPEKTSFEEAATIPLTVLASSLSLFKRQSLPPPWAPRSPLSPPLPLIIYGASSAVGCYAVKLARAANIHPIIAICGSGKEYVSKFIDESQGDTIVDYRQGVEPMVKEVKERLGSLSVLHALDAISKTNTWIPLTRMLSKPGGVVSVVSGAAKYDTDIPAGIDIVYTYVETSHSGAYKPTMPRQPADKEAVKTDTEFAFVLLRYVARLLARGDFEGHPAEVIPGGLDGVESGLQKLKAGKAKGVKFLYRVSETKGLTGN